ncbi:MAG: hypothetical protein FWE16_04765 [Firmicutes bacterium]|nr:hypothetical protein [Bacillota bacterium]
MKTGPIKKCTCTIKCPKRTRLDLAREDNATASTMLHREDRAVTDTTPRREVYYADEIRNLLSATETEIETAAKACYECPKSIEV